MWPFKKKAAPKPEQPVKTMTAHEMSQFLMNLSRRKLVALTMDLMLRLQQNGGYKEIS
jgi:hypothetical protein